MVVGAFLGGPMSSLGRRKSLITMCVVGIVGNMATFAYQSYGLILLGKFLSGVSSGGISCFCPKYIMECSPKEVSGSTGALFQLAVTVGICLNAIIALPYGDDVSGEAALELYMLLSALPILFALTQIFFLMVVFTDDTPIVMI
jgi:MFS family permease